MFAMLLIMRPMKESTISNAEMSMRTPLETPSFSMDPLKRHNCSLPHIALRRARGGRLAQFEGMATDTTALRNPPRLGGRVSANRQK